MQAVPQKWWDIISTTVIKLTDDRGQTQGPTQWGPNVRHKATGDGGLCTDGVIHAYRTPLLAVFMSPAHVGFNPPLAWEAEGEGEPFDDGTKLGFRAIKTTRVVELPSVTNEQRVRFGIGCVYLHPKNRVGGWRRWWANRWLSGRDRSITSAVAARAGWAAADEKCLASDVAFLVSTFVLDFADDLDTVAEKTRIARCAEWAVTDSLEVPE